MSEAERSIPRIAEPRKDLAVWLLTARAIIALIDNDPRSANVNFSAALRQAEAIPSFDEAARLHMKERLAYSYVRLGDGRKAESLFRELIEAFSKTVGPDDVNTLRTGIQLAQALLIQGKYADAVAETNLIYPVLVKKLGQDHEATMTLLGTRAAAEGSIAMWDEAIGDDLTLYRFAVHKLGPVSYFSIAPLVDAALSQCLAGRYTEGESNARKALQIAKQAFGPHAAISGAGSFTLATCLIGGNRLQEASDLLQEVDAKAIMQLTGDDTIEASVALSRGEIAARRGDYVLAQHYLEAAAPVFDRPNTRVPDKQALQKLRKTIDSHLRASR